MSQADDYNVRYRRFSKGIERMLIVLIISFGLILVAGEIFYQFEPVRKWLVETYRLEGVQAP